MPTTTRKLEIGALCDPISKQLDGLVSKEDAERLDRDNDAITYAYLRGYMPDSTTERARKKLLVRCQEANSTSSPRTWWPMNNTCSTRRHW